VVPVARQGRGPPEMSNIGIGRAGIAPIAAALERSAPVDELLDLVDAEIERARSERDQAALAELAVLLDEAARHLGPGGSGLAIAAARARFGLPSAESPRAREPSAPIAAESVAQSDAPAPAATTPALNYARWGTRVGAYLLDWFVLLICLGVLARSSAGLVFWLLLTFAYFTAFHAIRGQTLGKIAFGIAVRSSAGTPLEWGAAVGRTLTQALLSVVPFGFFVDTLWPLWDSQHRAVHDRAAGTVVVRIRQRNR
jgi:uncharacterized RDD family membrane protein YckC